MDGWATIESNPAVFTLLLQELGVQDLCVEECLSIDKTSLHGSKGLIFLFDYNAKTDSASSTRGTIDEGDDSLWFAQQTIHNACATQAVLSILFNRPDVNMGSELTSFKEFTSSFPTDVRGEALSNSEHIRITHNRFAPFDPFEALPQPEDDLRPRQSAHHYIAFLVINQQLYELDGLKQGPMHYGPCTDSEFADKVADVLQARINTFGSKSIDFALMSIKEDPLKQLQVQLAANPSDPNTLNEIHRITEQRKEYQEDVQLQRHNYLPLLLALCSAVAEKHGADAVRFDEFLASARSKTAERVNQEKSKRQGTR